MFLLYENLSMRLQAYISLAFVILSSRYNYSFSFLYFLA